MAHRDWNESYVAGDLPWDTGGPEPLLVEFVSSGRVQPTRALDIGAGTGTNSIYLAEHGFDVLGIGSRIVVQRTRKKKLRNQTCARFIPPTAMSTHCRIETMSLSPCCSTHHADRHGDADRGNGHGASLCCMMDR